MPEPTLITVSGPPGSGTTTLCERLSEALDFKYIYAGDIFRELAEERGMTLAEFTELCEVDDSIDRELDARMRSYAEEYSSNNTPLILESRLAGWVAGEHADLRIWLDAPADVRLDRTVDREDNESLEEMQIREESEAMRYRNYYDIDVTNLSIYDLVLNTSRWSIDTVFDQVQFAIKNYTQTDDEGSTALPIERDVFNYDE